MKRSTVTKPVKQDFHLKVAKYHVDMLNSIPEFCDLSTIQLHSMLPKRYRHFVPPVGPDFAVRDHAHAEEDRMARAVIIGMLATEAQIESHLSQRFLEKVSA